MNTLTGTRGLIRLILRRDRFVLPLWIVILALIPVGYVSSLNELFPTAASRRQYADNAGFVTLYGVLPDTGLGEFVSWRVGFVPVMVGLISILTVIRHTRTEEESGRRELLGSTVVGRHAALAAALATTLGADLLLGIVLALGLRSQDLSMTGSVALGAEFTLAGWIFAALAAVAAQLTAGAGAARGIALGTLGASYALRAAGDTSAHADGPLGWLSWLSPIGWVQKIHPYAENRWSLAVLALVVTLILIGVAITLSARRDVGSGLLPERPGPAVGAARLSTPLALAWRLHRGMLATWLVGFALLGTLFGSVAKGVGDLMRDDSATREFFARVGGKAGLIDSYFVSVLMITGLIAAAYAVQATLRLRVEETSGRAEPVLATATGRLRWATSHLVFALLGPAAALLAAGLGAGLSYGAAIGEPGRQTARLAGAALVQLPAVWVLAGIAIALFGLLPRLSAAAWAGPIICLLLAIVGAAAQLDRWVLDLSPFAHLPLLPGGGLHILPVTVLILIAAALAAVGLGGLRRRDLPA